MVFRRGSATKEIPTEFTGPDDDEARLMPTESEDAQRSRDVEKERNDWKSATASKRDTRTNSNRQECQVGCLES
jgi:hypothetical protein